MTLLHISLVFVLLLFGMSYDNGLHSVDYPYIVSTTSYWMVVALTSPAQLLGLHGTAPDLVACTADIANALLWGFAAACVVFRVQGRRIHSDQQ